MCVFAFHKLTCAINHAVGEHVNTHS